MLQTKCQSFPLEGVQLAIKRVILQNVLFAGQNLLIDVQRLIVCSDHLQKVRWRFEVIWKHLRQLPPDELHLNSTCFPNFEDRTPAAASLLDYFLNGFAPHAEWNAHALLLIWNTHEYYSFLLFLPLGLALALWFGQTSIFFLVLWLLGRTDVLGAHDGMITVLTIYNYTIAICLNVTTFASNQSYFNILFIDGDVILKRNSLR